MTHGPNHVSRLELAAVPSAASLSRLHAADILRRWRMSRLIDTATLLVSELVTNAIRHAGAAGVAAYPEERCVTCDRPLWPLPAPGSRDGVRRLTLTLTRAQASLIIEVYDQDPRPPVARPADPLSESGRGLPLVCQISERWGYYHPNSVGKVVWCELGQDGPAR